MPQNIDLEFYDVRCGDTLSHTLHIWIDRLSTHVGTPNKSMQIKLLQPTYPTLGVDLRRGLAYGKKNFEEKREYDRKEDRTTTINGIDVTKKTHPDLTMHIRWDIKNPKKSKKSVDR